MASLGYREAGLLARSSEQAVFGTEELDELVAALSRALATAGPGQQARFASFSRRGGTLGQLRKTEGVAFVDRDDRLNLAFVGVQEFAGPDEDFFRFLELSDRNPLTDGRSLITLQSDHPGHRSLPEQDRRPLPLWIRVDLSTASTQPERTAGPAVSDDPVPTGEDAEADIPEPASAPVTATPPSTEEDGTQHQVRRRLEFLKELHEDGLISTEEYQQQRREVLQRLD
ncbi:MAG: hypothetical protein EA419_03575 [Wenzhouxiangella sp.]|nr:MAG: hypothetical protein EA419_03575 [Wenzhouxiangella sp.]